MCLCVWGGFALRIFEICRLVYVGASIFLIPGLRVEAWNSRFMLGKKSTEGGEKDKLNRHHKYSLQSFFFFCQQIKVIFTFSASP